MRIVNVSLLISLVLSLFSCQQPKDIQWIANAPAGDRYATIDKQGVSIIPNGRLIQPYGKTITVAPHPFGLILSPDGKTAITANSGTSPLSVSIIKNIFGAQPNILQVPEGADTDRGILSAVYMGLAVSPDNQQLYVAGGQSNQIHIFRLEDGEKLGVIDCGIKNDSIDYSHGFIGDMAMTKDGATLYAVDQINFLLLEIDLETQQVKNRIKVGRYPFGICLSPDEQEAYVANVGMYEYRFFDSFDPEDPVNTSSKNLPFAYLSEEAEKGIDTDSLKIPGLGDPNAAEAFSVWTIQLADKSISAKTKTGILVGEMIEDFPAVGGASPNSVVATDDYVFVSNGNNDCISVIGTQSDTVEYTIWLSIDDRLGQLRGMIPYGLALSPDKKRLYVAEAGINAVGVIDIEKMETIGHIPVGWFPSKLQVSQDGKQLVVANAKGYGSGPNGGSTFDLGPEGSYIGALMKGSVTIMDIPSDAELKELTQQVIRNNFDFKKASDPAFAERRNNPVPLYGGEKESPIKYLVFVTKENRTYDEVFGQIEGGKGEADMARFGLQASFSRRNGELPLEGVDVMPNHVALARQFAISDNFYVDADHSADGHRWLAGTYPNEFVETNVPAAYGGNRGMRRNSNAPGNLAMVGASGAIHPEDYNEAGSLWDHLGRNQIPFLNFGCGTMFAPHLSGSLDFMEGYRYAINYPVSEALFENTSKRYPTYNMAIPEQYRIDQFIGEFTEKYLEGKEVLPSMMTVMMGNDHGAGERPDAGFPYTESYMADNDLALGRLVEFLSKTPYWKNMAIIVTEDDAQGGKDHVDAHRSLLMVISPYAKKSYVGHQHYSFGSIFKTFWHILGIPYLNQYDGAASDLADLFTNKPDTSAFEAIPIDRRLFDPQKAYDPMDIAFDWSALQEGPALDDEEYLIKEAEKADQKQ